MIIPFILILIILDLIIFFLCPFFHYKLHVSFYNLMCLYIPIFFISCLIMSFWSTMTKNYKFLKLF